MDPDDPLFKDPDPATGPGTDASQTAIYPLVSSSGNRRVLSDWLDRHDSYTVADEAGSVRESEFDLCIVDYDGLQRHAETLREVKSEAEPVLLPVLLLVPERRREIIETDQGQIADNVYATTVDEIVSLPIKQAELEWRIRALLRLRNQSVTSKRQTEKLRRFQEAVEASGHAIFITDQDGTITYVNPAFEEITGYSRSAVLGETPDILNSGEMSAEFFEDLWSTILSGETWRAEVVNRRKNGDLYTAYQTIAPITDSEGAVDAFVAVQTDITARKELQQRLKRHRDIVQRLEDPIMLQDTDGEYQLVNESMTALAGMDEADLLGRDEFDIMDDETAELVQQKKETVMDTETPATYTITPTFEKTGAKATFSTRRYPYYDEDDDLAGTITICRDITDLEKRTRQLRVIDNILRHNLRNSLTVIRSQAERLQHELSDDAAAELDPILAEADKLETTGKKSRAITKVLSDEPQLKRIGLAASVRSIVESVRIDHPEADIDVTAPEHAVVSATYNLDRAVEELVRNAIVHNDGESPTVEIRVEEVGDDVVVRIVDDGPGMSEMDREVLETGRAIEDLYHGSGLGLWLVYWIINRSDGSISVSEDDARGTTVTITLHRDERE
jgi:PAS domain S-box-containing protein